jgi:hypothetical protein
MENLEKLLELVIHKDAIIFRLNINGTNYVKVKKLISDNNLSTVHFLNTDFIKCII